jgi:hypothetical protein
VLINPPVSSVPADSGIGATRAGFLDCGCLRGESFTTDSLEDDDGLGVCVMNRVRMAVCISSSTTDS